jgi:hypothetical protein
MVMGACVRPPISAHVCSCRSHVPCAKSCHTSHPLCSGRQTDSATHFWIRIRSIFKRKGNDPVRTSSASVEMSDVAEGDRSPLSPVRRLDSSSYVPEEDV